MCVLPFIHKHFRNLEFNFNLSCIFKWLSNLGKKINLPSAAIC